MEQCRKAGGGRKVISVRRITKWGIAPYGKLRRRLPTVVFVEVCGSKNLRPLSPMLVDSGKAVVGSSTVVKREKRSNLEVEIRPKFEYLHGVKRNSKARGHRQLCCKLKAIPKSD